MERDDKKSQFEQPRKRGPLPLVAMVLCVIAAAAAVWIFLGGGSGVSSVHAEQGQVSIPLAQVSDGKAHYFTVRSGDADVRFFVLKSDDGVVRAAFDTCDVCYRENKGYRQDGDFMICNNCDMRFRSDMINEVQGGCNPAPLERRMAGDKLIIAEADISRGAWYFKNK